MASTNRLNIMTLDSYLSNYSKQRRIDTVIKQWFISLNGPQNVEKTKKEWDEILVKFYSSKGE